MELQQSPFLALISDRTVQQTLALMGQPKDARLTPEIAQQVCERTGSAAVLEGSIARVGSQYVLGLRARDCNTGNILDQQQAVAARKRGCPELSQRDVAKISNQSGRVAGDRGEALDAARRGHDTVIRSLESLQHRNEVEPILREHERPYLFFRRAVEIDPKFAMAYAQLGLSYSTSASPVLSAESATKAWQLRDRVSDRERFYIDFTYDRQVTGNLEKAYQTLELWSQTYPRRGAMLANAQGLLGGISTHGTGRFERAIEAAQEGIAADPDLAMRVCQSCVRPIFTRTVSRKRRARFSAPPSASWKCPLF